MWFRGASLKGNGELYATHRVPSALTIDLDQGGLFGSVDAAHLGTGFFLGKNFSFFSFFEVPTFEHPFESLYTCLNAYARINRTQHRLDRILKICPAHSVQIA